MTVREALRGFVILAAAAAAGCASVGGDGEDSAPGRVPDVTTIPDPVPRAEPRSARGNPPFYEVFGRRYYVMNEARGYNERGVASWYGTKFHGRLTSGGEAYDMYAMTAAHRGLPLPTYVRVRNLDNGREAVVKVNDRGPFHPNRVIGLSYAAATKLGILERGTGLVELEAIDPARPGVAARPATGGAPPDLFVQVGAFSSRDNADRLRRQLARSLRHGVRIQRAEHAGRPMFRVQVGPLASVEQADAATLRLSRLGIEETRVVIE